MATEDTKVPATANVGANATDAAGEDSSRRGMIISSLLLSASAAVSALVAACGGSSEGSGSGASGEGSGGGSSGGAGTGATGGSTTANAQPANPNDLAILNFAITAEYNAVKAYDAGIAILDTQHDAVAPVAKAVAQHFQAQHRSHADILTAAVNAMHGTPATADSASFTPPAGFPASPTTADVLKLAANAEKAASVIYTSRVSELSDPNLRFAAAAIAGDESQHWIVLYLLIKGHVTPTSSAQPGDVVPKAFVASLGNDAPGLESVPDFSYT